VTTRFSCIYVLVCFGKVYTSESWVDV